MRQAAVISRSARAQHLATVKELEAALPTIPYRGPVGSTPQERHESVAEWRKAAIAAGYPLCEECTAPIARSHWRNSITMCPLCEQRELGLRR